MKKILTAKMKLEIRKSYFMLNKFEFTAVVWLRNLNNQNITQKIFTLHLSNYYSKSKFEIKEKNK
jgi:hypothetical protein